MGMKESVKAYKRAGLAAEYHWWDKQAAIQGLTSLLEQLNNAPDDARLCCRQGLKDDGCATIWLSVEHEKKTRSHDVDPMDASHPCPPLC